MELGGNDLYLWEISLRTRKSAVRLGYCEGYICLNGEVRFIRPFTPQMLHLGPGIVLCRGMWTGSLVMKQEKIILLQLRPEPWMLISAEEIIRVQDFVSSLEIETKGEDGFRRRFD